MAILEAVLTSTYYNQVNVNRWHYISSGDPGPVTPSFGLLNAMGLVPPTSSPYAFTTGTIGHLLQQITSTSFGFLSIYVRNLYVPTDFIETAYNAATTGRDAGEPGAPFLAYGLISNRTRTDIRRGSKRIGGVSESAMDPGGVVTAAKYAQLSALATAMSDVLEYTSGGASLSFAPAVLSYEEYTTPRGRKAYRKYADPADQLEHAATGIEYVAYNRVRSQVSRQVGRGV